MDPAKCAVLVPVGTTLEPECEDCLRALADRGYPIRLFRGCSQIDLARSTMASAALQDGFRETMWIDSDVVFDPNDVDKLRSHNLPIVAGLYPKKGVVGFAGKFLLNDGTVGFGKEGGLTLMEGVGMGFTYVRAEVYAAIKRDRGLRDCGGGYDPAKTIVPYFVPLVVPDGIGGNCYLSEDYSFCYRAKMSGFKVLADTTIRLGHVGRHVYTWDDFQNRQRLESIQFTIDQPKIVDVRKASA